jgi:two-component system cell cycle sensor histidine kinase/response regulator CckA
MILFEHTGGHPQAPEIQAHRLTVLMLGGYTTGWNSCLAAIREGGINFDEQYLESSKQLLDRLVPGECHILLIASDSSGQLPPGVLEILNDKRLCLWAVVLTDGDNEVAVQGHLKTGLWDCVSRDTLWRLPTLAKRAMETYGLRQRLTEAEELWTGVTHDVSNLLGAVLAHSEFILMRVQHDEELRRAIEGIMKAAENAASWMTHGAAIDQLNGERRQILDLNEVVTRMESILRLLAGITIELRFQMGKEPVPVIADAAQIARIVLNLALNAVDAMPAGGQLTIKTEAEWVTPGAEAGSHAGPWGKLTVADSGQGIDTQQQPRIFDRFYSTRGPRRGLGLPTVRALIKRSGGYLEVKSTAGKGSAFEVYLPYARQLSDRPEVRSQPQSKSVKRILLVDDDAPLREVLARTLASAGYSVIEAGSAHEAIQIQAIQPGSIDLLLTDLRMSSMNGRDLAEVLRARDLEIKIIYISGYPDRRSDGAKNESDFLLKPFKPSALLEKIQACLREA